MSDTDRRAHLRADCSRCAALCCVAPAFARSADFAIDKPAGRPCPNLQQDLRCGIHADLRARGFAGCAVFDCFGAGQQVVQVTFRGRIGEPAEVFEVFAVMRPLHELLWYLVEAQDLAPAGLRSQVDEQLAAVQRLVQGAPRDVAQVDVAPLRSRVGDLLGRVSDAVRVPAGRDLRGADLVEAQLSGADLRNGTIRGALLLGADLRGADLSRADLLGADLRAADLRGARLASALFLTQPQVDAARGDGGTLLPPHLRRPATWVAAAR